MRVHASYATASVLRRSAPGRFALEERGQIKVKVSGLFLCSLFQLVSPTTRMYLVYYPTRIVPDASEKCNARVPGKRNFL